jgi:hypothetical protein
MMEACVPPKHRFLQEPLGVTSQKTAFFSVLHCHRLENTKSDIVEMKSLQQWSCGWCMVMSESKSQCLANGDVQFCTGECGVLGLAATSRKVVGMFTSGQ